MFILVINPGSTSTKVAIFEDEKLLAQENLAHPTNELSKFSKIFDQLDYRKNIVEGFLKKHNLSIEKIDAIAARGGPLPPSEGGAYVIDEKLIDATRNRYAAEHPSLLAALIAYEIGKPLNKKMFIVDPVSVDEWNDVARYSGLPELPRVSLSHALNLRAVAKRAANDLKREYSKINMIVVHLGGGISVAAHEKGRQIDANNANEDGPFSPERTGTLPVAALTKMCFSGKYSVQEMKDKITRKGGMVAYLGTNDVRDVLKKIQNGDPLARNVLNAMIYQVAKEIGKMAVVLKGKIDAIVISGGIAHNTEIVDALTKRIAFLAPVKVYPGEDEMEALAFGALRVLHGAEIAKTFNK